MTAAALALLLAGALPAEGQAFPPARVQAVLDEAAVELRRLRCYDAAAAALEEAQTARIDAGRDRAAARAAAAGRRAAYRRLLRCQRVDSVRPAR